MTARIPPTRTLRPQPDLDQLKRQAKELLDAFLAGEPSIASEVRARCRGADAATFALHDAQLVLARSYGFDSWAKLKARVDGVTVDRLCGAIERGDAATVEQLLRRRPEIIDCEWPDHGECRALHVAVLRRDAAMVHLLMAHGADARTGIYPNRDATGPLTIAAERGYHEIVGIIEEAEQRRREAHRTAAGDAFGPAAPLAILDADIWESGRARAMLAADPSLVHASHPAGWMPLHAAAATLNAEMVAWLLEHGANVHARGSGEWTPLDVAASGRWWSEGARPERFVTVAGILRRHGAAVSAVSAVALGDAAWVRARHAAGALATATTLHHFAPFGGLLSIAVRHEQSEMLRLLLDLGLDPDERVRLEGTDDVLFSWGHPLHRCARTGQFAMATLLLDRGADPNAQVSTSGSPTFAAYLNGDPAVIALLERHGGRLDAVSAASLRQTETARKMLAGEIDPGLQFGTFAGETVQEQLLWGGASSGDPEIVRLALARIDWPRDDNRWFWMLWQARPGEEASADEHARKVACFDLMLARCDPNVHSRFGQTILHELMARGDDAHGTGTTRLLDAGARLDVRDDLLKSTPLGWACRWGRVALVRLLLSRGADRVEADAEPWATPRAWAEKMRHDDVLRVLLAAPEDAA